MVSIQSTHETCAKLKTIVHWPVLTANGSINMGQSASCYLVIFDVSCDVTIYLCGLLLERTSIVCAQQTQFKRSVLFCGSSVWKQHYPWCTSRVYCTCDIFPDKLTALRIRTNGTWGLWSLVNGVVRHTNLCNQSSDFHSTVFVPCWPEFGWVTCYL